MLDFSRFKVLSFDCYGTIIDWERGIIDALIGVFMAHRVNAGRDELLELFGSLEAKAEASEYVPYRTVLQRVLDGIGEQHGFTPTHQEREAFADSVGRWPPFADSAAALQALKKKYKLAIISNVDDDLFARTAEQLGVDFDWVITAQQVRSYKPSPNNFLRAFERIGVPREQHLHVAQSVYHDIVPAKQLGLATVWVDRRRGQTGTGATPPATATPDLVVADLESLVDAATT
jgi:2-haloacid dehalogenase